MTLPTFHYALKPSGFLMLGAAESIGSFTELFGVVDKKDKIYSKKPAPTPALHLPVRKEHVELPVPGTRGLPSLPLSQGKSPLPEHLRGELSAQREADRISISQFAPPGVDYRAFAGSPVPRADPGVSEPPTGKASLTC